MNKYKNSFDINFKDDFDRNLFFYTKSRQDVRHLFKCGLDINHVDMFGRNALWGNGQSDYTEFANECIDELISLGVDLNRKDIYGQSIFSSFVFQNHIKVFMKHCDKFENKLVHQNNIYFNTISSLVENLNILKSYGFDYCLPKIIFLEFDPFSVIDKELSVNLRMSMLGKVKALISFVEKIKIDFPNTYRSHVFLCDGLKCTDESKAYTYDLFVKKLNTQPNLFIVK